MKLGRTFTVLSLLGAGLVFVNYLGSSLPFRFDLTGDSLYTLSPGSKKLVSSVEEPIQLEFYFSQSNESVPVMYKNYARRVQEMLRQYVRASGGRIQLSLVDPRPDSPEEERATAAGLSPQLLNTGEKVYFGLVATQADQQKVMAAINPQREPFLEYDLSQLLFSVQQVQRKKLGLLTGLPLQGAPANPMMMMRRQAAQQPQFILSELEKTFEIVTVDASMTSLPADLDALAVIHPQGLSPKLEYAIDQFILSGKPALLAVDPASQHFKQQSQGMMFGGPQPGVSSDLPRLFGAYGLDYRPGIVGDLRNAAPVQTGSGGVMRFPLWIYLKKEGLATDSLATAQLSSLLFVEAGSFRPAPESTAQFTPLVQTSAETGELDAAAAMMAQPETVSRDIKPDGVRTLAALVRGKFKSAFPEGAPKDAPAADGKEPPPAAPSAPGLKESSGTSTVIVVADTDWLMDSYSVRRMNFLGVQAAEPLNDNLAFASNALEMIAGSPDLIGLRGKGSSIRPFLVVDEMERQANARYQSQLQALDDKLASIQQKLTEIQGQKTGGNRLVASAEVQKALDDFRKQQAEANGERRKIRKALREDIEALENELLLVNLFAAPFAVVAFGAWFFRRRRTA